MSQFRRWFRCHEGWLAAMLIGAGVFGLGYTFASLRCSHDLALQRAHYTQEVSHTVDGYNAAMKAKDQAIKALSAQIKEESENSERADETR